MYEPDEMGEFMEKAEPYARWAAVCLFCLVCAAFLVYEYYA